MITYVFCVFVFFFFKQKTAYEMRISDWSSDVCSSDLFGQELTGRNFMQLKIFTLAGAAALALAACTAKEKPTQDDTAGAATTGGVTREEAKVEPDAPPGTPMPAATVIQYQTGPPNTYEARGGKGCGGTVRSRGAPVP